MIFFIYNLIWSLIALYYAKENFDIGNKRMGRIGLGLSAVCMTWGIICGIYIDF